MWKLTEIKPTAIIIHTFISIKQYFLYILSLFFWSTDNRSQPTYSFPGRRRACAPLITIVWGFHPLGAFCCGNLVIFHCCLAAALSLFHARYKGTPSFPGRPLFQNSPPDCFEIHPLPRDFEDCFACFASDQGLCPMDPAAFEKAGETFAPGFFCH